MKKFEFSALKLVEVCEIYVVTYDNKIISLDGETTFFKYSCAKNKLRNVLTYNYHQGHYWHEGKDNALASKGSCDGGGDGGGVKCELNKIYKKLGKELTEELLNENVFVIKKIQ